MCKLQPPCTWPRSTRNIWAALLWFSPLCFPIHWVFLLQTFLLTTCTLIHQIRNPFSFILSRYAVTQTCITSEGRGKKKKEKVKKNKIMQSEYQHFQTSSSFWTLGLVEFFATVLVFHLCHCDKYRFYWGQGLSSSKRGKKCSEAVKHKGSGLKY